MMILQKVFLLLLFTVLFFSIRAQPVKVISDLRMRPFIEVEKEISKKFTVFAETELSIEQNMSRFGRAYIGSGIVFSPNKQLDFDAKYRYTKNRKNYGDNYKNTHRIALSGKYKQKIDLFRFQYRLQYQNIDDEATWDGDYSSSRNYFKNRLRVKYNIWNSRWSPYVSTELYLFVNNKFRGVDASKLKSIAGIDYSIKGHGKAQFYYRNDKELVSFRPYSYHTIGFGYVFSL